MFLLGVPRPGRGGMTQGSALVFAGGQGQQGSFLALPQATGGGGGVAPSQAARLLLLHCFTAGGGKPACEFFFHSFLFCQTYSLPLVKVLTGA